MNKIDTLVSFTKHTVTVPLKSLTGEGSNNKILYHGTG